MKRLEIAQYIALGATCMTVLGFVINLATQSRWSMTMCGYGVMIGLISYFFGGIKTAVKMAGKIAKWGWIILPFPYDIVTGLVAFFISIFVFMALPIIPIRKAYKEQSMETRFIREEIGRCEDLEELKARIFPLLQSQQELWMQKMQEILAESGLTKSAFAKRFRVSRVSVDKWCKGAIPKNRETFLRIGMAAEYDLEKMNQLLRRYGQYPELYSKSLEDCVCIYVLNHRFDMDCVDNRESEKCEEAYGLTAYDYILSQIKENMAADADMEIPDINTAQFAERLSQVEDADALTQFIYDNIATFSSAYQKFYAYVKMYVTINYQRYSSSVANLAEGQGWSSSLRQCVSAIRQNKWYPTRNKIISLGLHLSMDHEQIDEMLTLAHMEPLCAKNLFESVILFILDDAELNNMLDTESEEFDPDELCRYARKVLLELDLPEIDAFLAELPDLDTDIW